MAFCAKCGAEIPEGDGFCGKCGTRTDMLSLPSVAETALGVAAVGAVQTFDTASKGLAYLLCKALHRCTRSEAKLPPDARYCENCGNPT